MTKIGNAYCIALGVRTPRIEDARSSFDANRHNAKSQRRTTRAIGARRILHTCLRVCPESLQEIANFSPEFGECDGLKNRRLAARKRSIGQVLISRTLSVCGEVAERLKAAVC